jgi:hypothetical protein
MEAARIQAFETFTVMSEGTKAFAQLLRNAGK